MLRCHGTGPAGQGVPFASSEDAWFWTIGALRARHDRQRRSGSGLLRPCEPDDVVRCLDGLYRERRIGLTHARVLRAWGERQIVPDRRRVDGDLWQEAMDCLAPVLRQKGIVK